MTDPQVTVKLQDADRVAAAAREGRFGWARLEVVLQRADTGVEEAANVLVEAEPRATAEPTLITTVDATHTVARIVQRGPHLSPVIYLPASPVTVATGETASVTLRDRLRISAWLDPHCMLDTATWQVSATARAKPFPGVDDFTLLPTVFNVGETDDVAWAPDFLDGNADHCARFLADLIQVLHAKRIQLFAGVYCDVSQKPTLDNNHTDHAAMGSRFARWITAKMDRARKEGVPLQSLFLDHAAKLVRFFDGFDIDGISYDLEIMSRGSTPNRLEAEHKPAITALYRAVADELAKRGRYLAFACSPDKGKGSETPFSSYDLARYPNIIARPMSYDGRTSVVPLALGPAFQLHPGQLQVGWSSFPVPGKGVGEAYAAVAADFGTLLRPHRTGLIQFGIHGLADADLLARADADLNANAPARGTLGQPLQGPLGPERIAAFRAAGAP